MSPPPITILNCYGEQEARSGKEEVLARWGRLLKELGAITARGDHCLLLGDLNKLVGCGPLGVPGNHPEVSQGGKLVLDLVQSGDWVLLNAREGVVEGGPFTRADPATGRESCLDLWLCSAGLAPHMKSLWIDRDRKLTVARPVWRSGKLQLVHSDHYTMIGTFHNLQAAKEGRQEQESEVRWNIPQKED